MTQDERGTAKDPDARGPKKPARKPFLVRLPPELLAELRTWANHDLRSLNAHIEFLLRQALQRRRGDGGEP